MDTGNTSLRRAYGWTLASACMGFAVFLAVSAMTLVQGRHDGIDTATVRAQNSARLIGAYLEQTIQKADMVLLDVKGHVRPADMRVPRNQDARRTEEVHRLLAAKLAAIPEGGALMLTNAAGDHLYSSLPAVPVVNVADRSHFIPHRESPTAGLVVSEPLLSRSTGKWAFIVSRRLGGDGESFVGTVNMVILLEGIEKFLGTIDLGRHAAVGLRDGDMRLMARSPAAASFVGMPATDHPAWPFLKQGIRNPLFNAPGVIDGVRRIYAFQQVDGHGLYAYAGVAEHDYLAKWRTDLAVFGLLGLLVASLLFVMAMLARRNLAEHEKVTRASFDTGQMLQLVLDTIPQGVYWKGRNLAYLGGNRIFLKDQGIETTEALAGKADEELPAGGAGGDRDGDRQVIEQGAALVARDEERTRADGTQVWVRYSKLPLRGIDGRIFGVLGVYEDITGRKRIEAELQRSNAELEQFAYAISHDMRQPLRMVVSYLQLIEKALKGRLDEETREYLAFAKDGAKRMDAMILGLLDFSRVGRKTEPMAALETRAALDEALAFLGPEIAGGGKVKVAGDWPALVLSRDEMVRLFQNLIGNALKFHAEGQAAEVEVEGRLLPKAWRCEVRDRGVGIDAGQADRLFKVFSRLQSRSRFDGSGVGLALCRKIVEHHGGRIGALSAGEGQGSTFWFELPLAAAAAIAAEKPG